MPRGSSRRTQQAAGDVGVAQGEIEIGLVKGAFAGLVNDRLALDRIERRNDVVPRFASDQNAPHRSGVTDPLAGRAALDLGGRRVG